MEAGLGGDRAVLGRGAAEGGGLDEGLDLLRVRAGLERRLRARADAPLRGDAALERELGPPGERGRTEEPRVMSVRPARDVDRT